MRYYYLRILTSYVTRLKRKTFEKNMYDIKSFFDLSNMKGKFIDNTNKKVLGNLKTKRLESL